MIQDFLNLYQEIGQNLYNSKMTIFQLATDIVKISKGSIVDEKVIIASLIYIGIYPNRFNLSKVISVSDLRLMSNDESMRLALKYCSIRNPSQDLYLGNENQIDQNPDLIDQLRQINLLHSYASNSILDLHEEYGEKFKIQNIKVIKHKQDLANKRKMMLSSSVYLLGQTYNISDPRVLSSIANLAINNFESTLIEHKNPPSKYTLNSEQAKRIILMINDRFRNIELQYDEQIEKISIDQYDDEFQFIL